MSTNLPEPVTLLVREVAAAMAADGVPDGLLERLLAAQRAWFPALDRFLASSGVGPEDPWWRQAVPADLFRLAVLFAGPEEAIRHTFASSGTTDPERRSRSAFSEQGLELMATSIRLNAGRMLFPDGRSTRILVLAPPPAVAPEMIMAWGMDRLVAGFGAPGSRFLFGPGGLDLPGVAALLGRAAADGVPITLIGASFSFVHLLDHLEGRTLSLPEGSRVMHAGGFKGRSREVGAEALRGGIAQALGIPRSHVLNLLGMTELASQFYEDRLLADREGRPASPGMVNAPWTRTEVLDPTTLEPAPPGEVGLLVHLDLANVERPAVVRTGDLGRRVGEAFEILGRARGESAGCSLSLDDLLESRRG